MSSTTSGPAPTPAQPEHGADTAALPLVPGMSSGAAEPEPSQARRRPSRRVALVGAGLLAAATAGVVVTLSGRDAGTSATPGGDQAGTAVAAAPARAVAPMPVAAVLGAGPDGRVPWQSPLGLSVTGGTLVAVEGTHPDGTPLAGAVGPDGTWRSTGTLVPAATYALTARTLDTSGDTRTVPVQVTTTPPEKTLGVTMIPGDGAVVGVGQAVSVRLATPVKDKAARAALEKRLTVTTVPAVAGSWRWMSSSELRYRGPELWAAGTKISVSAQLDGLQAVPGVWGTGTRTTSFTVGDALTAVVDNAAHTMTVSQNGQVVKVMKASMGKPQFPTRNGTFVVLEKFADRVMDSTTVDLPPGTPAYKTAVKDAVRITNSGTFTHGAPWSVGSQGRANVSHGCINLSPADAHWYYLHATRGDVITVVNSTAGPNLSDAGSQDWNMTFDQWKAGSALA